MPLRKVRLVNGEIYHVFNRSVARQPIFRNRREQSLFVKLIEYYRFLKTPIRFSHYLRLNVEEKIKSLSILYQQHRTLADVYAFTLMPNHYHLLLKQESESGIMNYIRLIQNSYARYLNLKTDRSGSLFQSPFKAVRIETDELLIHVARYIHLNPLTSYVAKDFNSLENYEWNSFGDYLKDNSRRFVNTTFLMKLFNNNKDKFEKFTKDNLDYQRQLEKIKHLTVE